MKNNEEEEGGGWGGEEEEEKMKFRKHVSKRGWWKRHGRIQGWKQRGGTTWKNAILEITLLNALAVPSQTGYYYRYYHCYAELSWCWVSWIWAEYEWMWGLGWAKYDWMWGLCWDDMSSRGRRLPRTTSDGSADYLYNNYCWVPRFRRAPNLPSSIARIFMFQKL